MAPLEYRSHLLLLLAGLLMTMLACGGNEGGGTDSLGFYEEQLVGTWYRYHAYDKSGEYYRFNTDRTSCYWEEHPSGSGQRTKKKAYSQWSVGSDSRTVTMTNAGITLTFDYPNMELWPTGYPSLVYSKSSSHLCE